MNNLLKFLKKLIQIKEIQLFGELFTIKDFIGSFLNTKTTKIFDLHYD